MLLFGFEYENILFLLPTDKSRELLITTRDCGRPARFYYTY